MEWFSYVIASGIGLSAVISPIATAIINNRHQLSIKKLDIYEEAKRKSLNNFIECTERYILDIVSEFTYNENVVNYYSSLDKLFIYFENITLDTFSSLEKATKNNKYQEATIELTNIVQELSKQIPKK